MSFWFFQNNSNLDLNLGFCFSSLSAEMLAKYLKFWVSLSLHVDNYSNYNYSGKYLIGAKYYLKYFMYSNQFYTLYNFKAYFIDEETEARWSQMIYPMWGRIEINGKNHQCWSWDSAQ